jgi:hypothetical protein
MSKKKYPTILTGNDYAISKELKTRKHKFEIKKANIGYIYGKNCGYKKLILLYRDSFPSKLSIQRLIKNRNLPWPDSKMLINTIEYKYESSRNS